MVDSSAQAGRRGLALLLAVTRKIKELYYIIFAMSLQKSVASGAWFLNLNLSSACLSPASDISSCCTGLCIYKEIISVCFRGLWIIK